MSSVEYDSYSNLLQKYRRMFGMVDAFHFNSPNTAEVYRLHVGSIPDESMVIPITHSGVVDHRQKRDFNTSNLRLGFIGSEIPYKGLPVLKKVIGRLNAEGYEERVSLKIYCRRIAKDQDCPNIFYCGHFDSSEMQEVYESMDLLVVPSIWCETFSLTTIEALQFGVPVLVSDKVGAKDIVARYDRRFVYHTEKDLYDIIYSLLNDKTLLKTYNQRIVSLSWNMSEEKHSKEIVEFYKAVVNRAI